MDLLSQSLFIKGPFNNYVDKMRGGGSQKMSVFVHAQDIKTVHAEGAQCYVLRLRWQFDILIECFKNCQKLF